MEHVRLGGGGEYSVCLGLVLFMLLACSAKAQNVSLNPNVDPYSKTVPFGQNSAYSAAIPASKPIQYRFRDGLFEMGVMARAFYRMDQRIQWTGNETVMGAEGIVTPSITLSSGVSRFRVAGEFYLNQPYDKNFYTGNVEGYSADTHDSRASYAANFDREYFETPQLYLSWVRNNFEFRAGKMATPFGRYYVPMMSNEWSDAPFIRSESIIKRQTGLLLRWNPAIWEFDAGIFNGSEGLDTNSMKAVIARAGINLGCFQMGISALVQDGIGSEEQKEEKSHYGADAALKMGHWTLSGEVIYDQYGLRKEFDPNDIFWGRSIYYRQIYNGGDPISGVGYYIDLNYQAGPWCFDLNYGEYHPEKLRNPDFPQHDIVNRRFMAKLAREVSRYAQWYGAIILENDGFVAQRGRDRRGWYLLTGVKFEL